METGAIVQILIATGMLTAISETFRWYLGRGKTKVDSALVVQGMAIDLLKPLHDELARANEQALNLRKQMSDLDQEMEIIISWALTVKGILEANGIEHPPLPKLSDRRF